MANLAAELKQFFGTKTQRMFLGVVKPCPKKNAAKVVTYQYDMDEALLAYFREPHTYYAYDEGKQCKAGDLVLIKELPEKKTTLITHEVLKILFPMGDITCPLTGRKVVNIQRRDPQYRDDIEKLHDVYGKSPNRFNYEDAPPRGWQEGRRDFSDKENSICTHDEGKFNPYKVHL